MKLNSSIQNYNLHSAINFHLNNYSEYDEDRALEDNEIIVKVLAEIEGENDGASWHWIVEFNNGKYAYITGGCDYTGWDCQSHANIYYGDSLEEVLEHTPNYDNYNKKVTEILYNQLFNERLQQVIKE